MRKILITGGAGFIGVNTARHYLAKGDKVTIFDNLSRRGTEINLQLLKKDYSPVRFVQGDIREFRKLRSLVTGQDIIFHFAGQVAVTTSLLNPREDFEINAGGTLNLLEAVRVTGGNPLILDSSTNKVYGDLTYLKLRETPTRWEFADRCSGVSEQARLDFYSPYGCSKGTADSYMRDYHRVFGLRTIVFRQSCIYGPHQLGLEDQGWVAWFIIAGLLGWPITIYGDGKQVRDLLHIRDLLTAFDLAIAHPDKTVGQVYNIGGGPTNTISIWFELRPLLEKLLGQKLQATFAPVRPGDQLIFVADTSKAKADFGWEPRINFRQGLRELFTWLKEHEDVIRRVYPESSRRVYLSSRRAVTKSRKAQ